MIVTREIPSQIEATLSTLNPSFVYSKSVLKSSMAWHLKFKHAKMLNVGLRKSAATCRPDDVALAI